MAGPYFDLGGLIEADRRAEAAARGVPMFNNPNPYVVSAAFNPNAAAPAFGWLRELLPSMQAIWERMPMGGARMPVVGVGGGGSTASKPTGKTPAAPQPKTPAAQPPAAPAAQQDKGKTPAPAVQPTAATPIVQQSISNSEPVLERAVNEGNTPPGGFLNSILDFIPSIPDINEGDLEYVSLGDTLPAPQRDPYEETVLERAVNEGNTPPTDYGDLLDALGDPRLTAGAAAAAAAPSFFRWLASRLRPQVSFISEVPNIPGISSGNIPTAISGVADQVALSGPQARLALPSGANAGTQVVNNRIPPSPELVPRGNPTLPLSPSSGAAVEIPVPRTLKAIAELPARGVFELPFEENAPAIVPSNRPRLPQWSPAYAARNALRATSLPSLILGLIADEREAANRANEYQMRIASGQKPDPVIGGIILEDGQTILMPDGSLQLLPMQ